jgi:general secretion pathway protein D
MISIKFKNRIFMKFPVNIFLILLLLTFFSAFSGCTNNHIKTAESLSHNRQYEEALDHYLKALRSNPDSIDLKIDIDRLLKDASEYYYYLAMEQEKIGKPEMAVFLYKKSLEFDPANNRSRKSLSLLINEDIKSIDSIKKETEINIGFPDVFKGKESIDLIFKHKISLMKIFEVLAKSGNINILFDSGFRDRAISFSMVQTSFQDALERLCMMFNLRYYIMDNKNIIITSDSGDSEKRYKKLVMKNLYFSNVDAQEAKQVIESVVRPEKLIVNKKTNSLIVTDSLRNIALIEKLSQFIDKRDGEVEIEVEIMEVDRKKLKEYGSELSSYQIGAEVEGLSDGKRLNNLFYLSADDVILTMPKMVWKLFSSITNTKILARPRVRGLDRQKIEIMLGEKRPILRTTFVPVSTGGQDQQPISAYDMKDVGISLQIVPTIHFNSEVTLDLSFELTYVTDLGGTYMPPTLGNRKVSTQLRLGDGETGIIAGLMRGTSTEGTDGIPILNSIPIVKEVFSSRSKTRERTDLLLSITPRILRMPEITRSDLEAYLIGTGQKVELKKWKDHKSDQDIKKEKKNEE